MNTRREDLASAAFGSDARVTTVVVTYNSAGTIGATLKALESTVSSGFNRCVVVDNDSADNTVSQIEQDFPWVIVVRSPENLGFARGCNLGFEKANTPYVLFLNPDAVLPASALHMLFEFMEDNTDVAVTAPATWVGDSGFQKAGMLTTPGQLLRSALGLPDPYRGAAVVAFGEAARDTNWVCGAIMLIRSSSFLRAGGFDPRYFLYFDETDLFLRIRALAERIVVVGAAEASHVGGASTKASGEAISHGCIAQHYYESRYYYLVKNFGFVRATGIECISAFLDMLRCVRAMLLGRPVDEESKPWRRPFLRFPKRPAETHTGLTGIPAESR